MVAIEAMLALKQPRRTERCDHVTRQHFKTRLTQGSFEALLVLEHHHLPDRLSSFLDHAPNHRYRDLQSPRYDTGLSLTQVASPERDSAASKGNDRRMNRNSGPVSPIMLTKRLAGSSSDFHSVA